MRLVPALCASAVVPLAGLISRQLNHKQQGAAIAAAAIALTLLPLMRHGRLAMLDGALVSASGLLWWQLLVSRQCQGLAVTGLRSSQWGWLAAPCCCSKHHLLLPVLGIGLLLLLLERQLGRNSNGLSCYLALPSGCCPGSGLALVSLAQRGSDALLLWGGDGASRVLLSAGEGSDLGWRVPVLEVLEGGWPWLALWPFAVVMAWKQRHLSASRWPLGCNWRWPWLCCHCARNCPGTATSFGCRLPCSAALPWRNWCKAANPAPWPGSGWHWGWRCCLSALVT